MCVTLNTRRTETACIKDTSRAEHVISYTVRLRAHVCDCATCNDMRLNKGVCRNIRSTDASLDQLRRALALDGNGVGIAALLTNCLHTNHKR